LRVSLNSPLGVRGSICSMARLPSINLGAYASCDIGSTPFANLNLGNRPTLRHALPLAVPTFLNVHVASPLPLRTQSLLISGVPVDCTNGGGVLR